MGGKSSNARGGRTVTCSGVPPPNHASTPRESASPARAEVSPRAAIASDAHAGVRRTPPRTFVTDRTPVPWKTRIEGRRAAASRRRTLERTIAGVGGAVIAAGVTIAAVLPPSPFAPAALRAVHDLPAHVADMKRRATGFAIGLVPSSSPMTGPWAASREHAPQSLPPLPTVIKWFPPPTYTAARPTGALPTSTRATARDTFPPTATVAASVTPWPSTTAIPTQTAAPSATAVPTETLAPTPEPQRSNTRAVAPGPTVTLAAQSWATSPPAEWTRASRDAGDDSTVESPHPTPTAEPSRHAVVAPRTDAALLDAIRAALTIDPQHAAISVMHLETGTAAAINDDRTVVPASLYKLGVLVEAYRQIEAGTLRTDEPLRLLPTDWAPGAGILQGRIGSQVSVADALRLMIGISDNVAAHALVRRIGVDHVNANNQRLGLAGTRYYVDDRPDTTTASDMARLLSLLAQGKVAGPDATAQMITLMRQVQPAAWLPKGVPGTVPVAHKSGQLAGVRNDAGIVYGPTGPYVVVVLTDNRRNPALGEGAITSVARSVHAFFAAGG
jgi:beta-lactamase class A